MCSLVHDVHLYEVVHLYLSACLTGEMKVGPPSWLGVGTSVIQQVSTSSDFSVGIGVAMEIRDAFSGTMVAINLLCVFEES